MESTWMEATKNDRSGIQLFTDIQLAGIGGIWQRRWHSFRAYPLFEHQVGHFQNSVMWSLVCITLYYIHSVTCSRCSTITVTHQKLDINETRKFVLSNSRSCNSISALWPEIWSGKIRQISPLLALVPTINERVVVPTHTHTQTLKSHISIIPTVYNKQAPIRQTCQINKKSSWSLNFFLNVLFHQPLETDKLLWKKGLMKKSLRILTKVPSNHIIPERCSCSQRQQRKPHQTALTSR